MRSWRRPVCSCRFPPRFSHLKKIKISAAVQTIQLGAFWGCTGLTAFEADRNNQYYSSDNGILYNKDKTVLIQCPAQKSGSLQIPDTVTKITTKAFDRCIYLTEAVIPDSVATLDPAAFCNCTGLTYMIIPGSLNKISDSLFANCTGLTGVSIPDSVKSVGSFAFYGCTGIKSFTLPESVVWIGSCTFSGCTGLTETTIPQSVKKMSVCTDMDGELYSNAFSGCTQLKNVIFRGSTIGYGHNFERCTNLESVTFSDSVDTVTDIVTSCSHLKSVTIHNSVSSIAKDAFKGCASLTDLYFHGPESEWKELSVDSDGNALISGLNNTTIHYIYSGNAPQIISQPADTSATVGRNVSFSVAAEGNGLSYQWY